MEASTQNIKQRFGIIGNDPVLNRSIEKAMRVSQIGRAHVWTPVT